MTNKEKKQLARSLFIKSGINRKQLAQQVGCTEKTLRGWIAKEGWEQVREAETITRSQLRKDAYRQLAAINTVINEQMNGVPDKKLSDAKGVIRKEIEVLGEMPLHSYVEMAMELTAYVQANCPDKLIEITEMLDDFIQEKAKENQ